MNKDEVVEFLKKTLNECPEYPCRVDEMTEREFKMCIIVSHLCGAINFLKEKLDEDEKSEKRFHGWV
jgi:hypothetical protein